MSLRKQEIDATELYDVKVKQVSLVKRGANMLPIKIQKSEDPKMSIDLGRLFKRDITKPTVAMIVVSKGADIDKAKRRIESAGFSIEKSEEVEGHTHFIQSDVPYKDDGVAIKFDDDLAVIIANPSEDIKKGFESWNFQSTDFKEMLSQEGFFDSVGSARYVLGTAINNIMQKADTADEAADLVQKAIADFGMYITSLVKAIPVEAFKLEDAEILKSADGPVGDESSGETSTEESDADQNSNPDAAAGNGTEGDAEGQAAPADEPEGSGGDGAGDEGEAVAKSSDSILLDGVKGLLDTFKTQVTTQITGLSQSVEKIQGNLDKVSKDMGDKIEGVAKANDEAVAGIIGGDANNDPVRKTGGESNGEIPPIDTAYR